jgi:hypothetical protein
MMLADALVFTILSSSFPSVVNIKTRPFLFLLDAGFKATVTEGNEMRR